MKLLCLKFRKERALIEEQDNNCDSETRYLLDARNLERTKYFSLLNVYKRQRTS